MASLPQRIKSCQVCLVVGYLFCYHGNQEQKKKYCWEYFVTQQRWVDELAFNQLQKVISL